MEYEYDQAYVMPQAQRGEKLKSLRTPTCPQLLLANDLTAVQTSEFSFYHIGNV